MKRYILVVVSVLLVFLMMPTAFAVPSKDTSSVTQVIGASENSPSVVEPTTQTTALLSDIYQYNTDGAPVAEYFPNDVRDEIEALLPGVDMDSLELNEFITIETPVLDGAYGDSEVMFEFGTPFVEGQNLVAMVGQIDSLGNVTWYACEAVVVVETDDQGVAHSYVSVTFPEEVLANIAGQPVALAILSEPV